MFTTSNGFGWSTIFKVGYVGTEVAFCFLIALGSSTLDDVGPGGEDKFSIVVSEAVVWEVRWML